MAEGKTQGGAVSRGTLILAVVISVVLTGVIVGSIIFAWQNAEVTTDDVFRQDLLQTETDGLENALDIIKDENQVAN